MKIPGSLWWSMTERRTRQNVISLAVICLVFAGVGVPMDRDARRIFLFTMLLFMGVAGGQWWRRVMNSPRVRLLPSGQSRLTRSALGGAPFAAIMAGACAALALVVLRYSGDEITEFLKHALLWMVVAFFVSGPWYPRGLPMQAAFLIIVVAPLSGRSVMAPLIVALAVFALHLFARSAVCLHHRRLLRKVCAKSASAWRRMLYGGRWSEGHERDRTSPRFRHSTRAPVDQFVSNGLVRWLNVALLTVLSWMLVAMPGVGTWQPGLAVCALFVLCLTGVHGQPHVNAVWLQPRGVRRAEIGRATVASMMRAAKTTIWVPTLLLVVAQILLARELSTAVSALGAGLVLWAGLRVVATAIVCEIGRRGGMSPLIMFALAFAAIVSAWRAFAWWLFPSYDERHNETLQQDAVHNAFLYVSLAVTFYTISEAWLRVQRARWSVVDLAAITKSRQQTRETAKRTIGTRLTN